MVRGSGQGTGRGNTKSHDVPYEQVLFYQSTLWQKLKKQLAIAGKIGAIQRPEMVQTIPRDHVDV